MQGDMERLLPETKALIANRHYFYDLLAQLQSESASQGGEEGDREGIHFIFMYELSTVE